MEFANLYSHLASRTILQELKLSTAQIQAVQGRQAAASNVSSSGDTALSEILTADQVRRYRQIQLQERSAQEGPLSVFRYRPVVERLSLTDEQATKLKSAYQDVFSSRWLPLISRFPQVTQVTTTERDEGQRTIEGILTAEQKRRAGRKYWANRCRKRGRVSPFHP